MSMGLSIALGLPIAGLVGFVASRRRLKLQWREELMDAGGGVYTKPSVSDITTYFRRVKPVEDYDTNEYQPSGAMLGPAEYFGLIPLLNLFSPEETQALLEDASDWASLYGQPLEERMSNYIQDVVCTPIGSETFIKSLHTSQGRAAVRNVLNTLGAWIASRKAGGVSNVVVSDHAVDCRVMKAPWGSGDAMQMDKLPMSLRWAAKKIQTRCPNIGALRHVFLEYSADGVLCRPPAAPSAFDGHEYVVIPLTHMAKSSSVITFSPVLRSRHTSSTDTLVNSWTSRDVDALVPGGAALRVVGEARYMWGWGIRPLQWFGTCGNTARSLKVAAGARTGVEGGGEVPESTNWSHRVASWFTRRGSAFVAASDGSPKPAAVLVLHFEGPRSSTKQRQRWLQPEMFVFGTPPIPQTFEHWQESRPSKDEVMDDYVLLFMFKHYLELLST